MSAKLPRVVVIGCGFGGLEAVRALSKAPVEITLIDRTNHHLFQPLLYQVATAGLSAPAISAPIRHTLRREMRRGNLTILQGEVVGVDATARRIALAPTAPDSDRNDGNYGGDDSGGSDSSDGGAIEYDHLIVAAGSTNSYFGHSEW
ncbi:MAG: FAD-dependent oxidoreductase, partial [Caldimonas sp.]